MTDVENDRNNDCTVDNVDAEVDVTKIERKAILCRITLADTKTIEVIFCTFLSNSALLDTLAADATGKFPPGLNVARIAFQLLDPLRVAASVNVAVADSTR